MRKLMLAVLITFLFIGVGNAQALTYKLVKLFDKTMFTNPNERVVSYHLNTTGDIMAVETNLSVYKVVAQ